MKKMSVSIQSNMTNFKWMMTLHLCVLYSPLKLYMPDRKYEIKWWFNMSRWSKQYSFPKLIWQSFINTRNMYISLISNKCFCVLKGSFMFNSEVILRYFNMPTCLWWCSSISHSAGQRNDCCQSEFQK